MEKIWEPRTVCIIDDDPIIRDMYATKFRQEGYEVIPAENGEQGLKLVREKKPDIILLDLQMPVMNGLQVLKELQKDEAIANIPVVVLSNIDDEEVFKEVGKFETRFYLGKVMTTPQKAIDVVKEVLHNK